MSKTLLLGSGGQLAAELNPLLSGEVIALSRGECDLRDPAGALNTHEPSLVVNCAAYNAVDQAEEDPEVAYEVNALGPRRLATWCRDRGARLVHVSTDFVFGLDRDRTRPYSESDVPGPVSAYGTSKLAGEHFVLASSSEHLVVRTCGLYGVGRDAQNVERQGGNFVETMLRLSVSHDTVRVVDDQVCSPTSCAELASWIASLIREGASGLVHATASGECTWAQFAAAVFEEAGADTTVESITSAEFGAPAERPRYSVLDGSRLTSFGIERSSWREQLANYIARRTT